MPNDKYPSVPKSIGQCKQHHSDDRELEQFTDDFDYFQPRLHGMRQFDGSLYGHGYKWRNITQFSMESKWF